MSTSVVWIRAATLLLVGAAPAPLLALDSHHRNELFFWIREEKGTSSELDFLIPEGARLIPIEVKSGKQGSLKSLHQFLSRSRTKFGLRFYNGLPSMEDHAVTLPGGETIKLTLMSLPLYLVFRLKTMA